MWIWEVEPNYLLYKRVFLAVTASLICETSNQNGNVSILLNKFPEWFAFTKQPMKNIFLNMFHHIIIYAASFYNISERWILNSDAEIFMCYSAQAFFKGANRDRPLLLLDQSQQSTLKRNKFYLPDLKRLVCISSFQPSTEQITGKNQLVRKKSA